jgi:GNAT superfamily N-acetyltransferase
MIVREANQEDIDSIIVLLQASLGESLLKKSAEIWNFKHVINPFGESTVLLAEEDSELIGVRAFMNWRWQCGNQVWNAYRAVDTATHPNHQGKGIFKKLTLQALDKIHENGDCFVFNTPNDQSRPGYLKMGWQEVDKIKVALVPTFFYVLNFLFSKKKVKSSITTLELVTLCDMHNQNLVAKNVLFTPKSAQYLKWRYENNALQDYIIFATPEFYIAMYVKKHRFFNELRIVETIGVDEVRSHKLVKNIIVKQAFQSKCLLITLADENLFSLKIYGSFGPKFTFRPLTNSNIFIQKALQIRNWGYALGDLELF